jgi:hypothetical protein
MGVSFILKKSWKEYCKNHEIDKYESLNLTFSHPRMVSGKSNIKLLNTISEKIELLEK